MICTILYEDQRGPMPDRFVPHELLLRCISDETSVYFEKLNRLIKARPLNGNGNVKREIEMHLQEYLNYGPVIAVFDLDKAWNCYHPPLQGNSCKAQIIAAIRGQPPRDVTVVFLDKNMETLVSACHQTLQLGTPIPKKSLESRDQIISQIKQKTERDQVRKAVSSFDRLVKQVADWIKTQNI